MPRSEDSKVDIETVKLMRDMNISLRKALDFLVERILSAGKKIDSTGTATNIPNTTSGSSPTASPCPPILSGMNLTSQREQYEHPLVDAIEYVFDLLKERLPKKGVFGDLLSFFKGKSSGLAKMMSKGKGGILEWLLSLFGITGRLPTLLTGITFIAGLVALLYGLFTDSKWKGLMKVLGKHVVTGPVKLAAQIINGLAKLATSLFRWLMPETITKWFDNVIMTFKNAAKTFTPFFMRPGWIKLTFGPAAGHLAMKLTRQATTGAFRAIPFVGGIIDLGFAAYRFAKGDIIGGFIDLISGLINIVGGIIIVASGGAATPIVLPITTAISLGLGVLNAFLDLKAGGPGTPGITAKKINLLGSMAKVIGPEVIKMLLLTTGLLPFVMFGQGLWTIAKGGSVKDALLDMALLIPGLKPIADLLGIESGTPSTTLAGGDVKAADIFNNIFDLIWDAMYYIIVWPIKKFLEITLKSGAWLLGRGVDLIMWIGELTNSIVQWVADIIYGIYEYFSNVTLSELWGDIKSLPGKLWGYIVGFLKGVWKSIANWWNNLDIVDKINEFFDGFWGDIGKHIGDKFADLDNAVINWFRELDLIGIFIGHSPGPLNDTIDAIEEGWKTSTDKLIDYIKDLFTRPFTVVLDSVTSVINVFTGGVFGWMPSIIASINGVIERAKKDINAQNEIVYNKLIGAYHRSTNILTDTIHRFLDYIEPLLNDPGKVVKGIAQSIWEKLSLIPTKIYEYVVDLSSQILNFVGISRQSVQELLEKVRSFIPAIFDTIKSSITLTKNTIINTISSITNNIKGFFERFVKDVTAQNKIVYNKIVGGYRRVTNIATDTIHKFLDHVDTLFNRVANIVPDIIHRFLDHVDSLFEQADKLFKDIKQSIYSTLTFIPTKIYEYVVDLSGRILNIGSTYYQSVRNLIQKVKEFVPAIFDTIKSSITLTKNTIINTISSTTNNIKGFFERFVKDVTAQNKIVYNKLIGGYRRVTNIATDTIHKFLDHVDSLFEQADKLFKDIKQSIYSTLTFIPTKIYEYVVDLSGRILNIGSTYYQSVRNLIQKVKEFVPNIFDTVKLSVVHTQDVIIRTIISIVGHVVNMLEEFKTDINSHNTKAKNKLTNSYHRFIMIIPNSLDRILDHVEAEFKKAEDAVIDKLTNNVAVRTIKGIIGFSPGPINNIMDAIDSTFSGASDTVVGIIKKVVPQKILKSVSSTIKSITEGFEFVVDGFKSVVWKAFGINKIIGYARSMSTSLSLLVSMMRTLTRRVTSNSTHISESIHRGIKLGFATGMKDAGIVEAIADGISKLQLKDMKPVSVQIDAQFDRMVALQGQTFDVLDQKISGILQEINSGIRHIQPSDTQGDAQLINLPQQSPNSFDTLNAAYLDRQNLVRP